MNLVSGLERSCLLFSCSGHQALSSLSSEISLPLENQKQPEEDERFEKGLAIQVATFGESLRQRQQSAPENQKHIQEYLSAFCFGDIYSRSGLDIKTREPLTLCIISALGGCENQLRCDVQGNLNVGDDSLRCNRLSDHLALEGIGVSTPTIQRILNDNEMSTRYHRWLKLEQQQAEQAIELSAEQVQFTLSADPRPHETPSGVRRSAGSRRE
jgi:alkylhydroperoxidase/carboxymuconolactone decarboxylase family protein YurZ